ncbi:MAG TPA: hypothetical protein VLK26_10400 [Rudaea sp.]|nr:hypothetical protein [Rudaea sp.]
MTARHWGTAASSQRRVRAWGYNFVEIIHMQCTLLGAALRGALVLVTPCVAIAAPATSAEKASTAAKPAAPAQGQVRAYIDPETGQLVDHPVTEEQKRAAQQGMKAPGASVVQTFHRADGSIEVVLNGAADSELIATVGKDGKVKVECTDNSHKLPLQEMKPQAEAPDER